MKKSLLLFFIIITNLLIVGKVDASISSTPVQQKAILSSGSTVSVALNITPTNGNTLILFGASSDTTVHINSISETGVTWQVASATHSNKTAEIWYGTVGSSPSFSITVTLSGTPSQTFRGGVSEWTGVLTSGALDAHSGNSGSSNTPTTASVTPTAGQNELIIANTEGTGNTGSPTNGFTALTAQDFSASYLVVPFTSGSYSTAWTSVSSGIWETEIATFTGGAGTPVFNPVPSGLVSMPPSDLGLVGYWSMNEGFGSIAHDFSGFGSNGTLSGAALPEWVQGKRSNALSFAGTTGSVNISPIPSARNPLTVSAWVYPTSLSQTSFGLSQGGTIIDEDEDGASDGWELGIKNNNTIWFWPSASNDRFSTKTVPLNTWSHVAITYDGSNISFYINGVLDTTQAMPVPQGSATLFKLGAKAWITGAWSGKLDEVRVYNRSLSSTEISSLYSSGSVKFKPPTSTGLIGYWPMDDATGTTASDLSGNNNFMNTGGSPKWVSGKHGKAMNFNGSTDYLEIPNHAKAIVTASPLTICAWFYPTSAVDAAIAGVSYWAGSSGLGFELNLRSTGNIRASASGAFATTIASYAVNAWNYGCAVFSSNSSRTIYLNGGNAITDSTTAGAYSVDTTFIGARPSNGGYSNFFPGKIDDVRTYNRALSATEIASLYGSGQVAQNASQNNKMTNGLVGLWSMNGQDITWANNFMVDGSGNHNDGTLNSFNQKNSIDFGVSGQALKFDGSASYISTATQFANPQSFSIATWFKTTNASGHKLIGFESNQTGTGSGSYDRHLYMGTDGKIYFGWYTGSVVTVASTATLNDGNWHLAVGTHDGTTGTLYIDGVSQGTNTGAPQAFSGYWRLGGYKLSSWTNASDGYFSGSLDEARVYNRILSSAEVKQLYNMSVHQ